jgi:glucan phosphorylase
LNENLDSSFDEAVVAVRAKCVFTTHTPVSAGNDEFSPEKIRQCFDANFISDLKISESKFFELGRTNPEDETEWFGMTPLALRMCRSANGVSEKHGEVSRELWHRMFSENTEVNDVPITHITNGVHAPTWIAPVFQTLYENTSETIGRKFREIRLNGLAQSNRFPTRKFGNRTNFSKTCSFYLSVKELSLKKPGCTKPLTNIRTPENYSVPTF